MRISEARKIRRIILFSLICLLFFLIILWIENYFINVIYNFLIKNQIQTSHPKYSFNFNSKEGGDNKRDGRRVDKAVVIEPKTQTAKLLDDTSLVFYGIASYYSSSGCLGCHPEQIMANGEKFNENAFTLAFNHLPLNTMVKVVNVENGAEVVGKVTDRGGFNSLGRKISNIEGDNNLERIADLSLAMKNALGCGGLCKIKILKVQ